MFKDQVLDNNVLDLNRPKGEDHSPTPNDWNQSDIDSEFHRFDPKRYPARKPKPEPEISDTISYAPSGMTISKNTNSVYGGVLDKAQRSQISSKGPTFGQLTSIRQRQDRSKQKKQSPPNKNQSNLTVLKNKKDDNKSRQRVHSSSQRSRKNRSMGKRARFQEGGTGSEMTAIITQDEIDRLNRQVKPVEDTKPQSSRRTAKLKERKMTLPGITIQNVEPEMRKMLDTAEGQNKSGFFQMDTMDEDMLNEEIELKKMNTVDDSFRYNQEGTPKLQSRDTSVIERETSDPDTIQTYKSQYVSPWPTSMDSRNNDQWKSSTIQIQGQSKELTQMRRNLPHQDSSFSFRGRPGGSQQPISKPKFSSPQQYQRKEKREETPEKILREFNEKARAYKLGIDFNAKMKQGSATAAATGKASAGTKPVGKSWRELMTETKDEWDMTTADMYNPSPSVLYDAYLINLSHTVGARLSQIVGKNMRVNLRQGKPFKKIQINVTTVHQTKYRLTKYGNGFGYGTTDKLSPEDAFLQTIFEKAAPDVRERKRLVGQRETLAQLVPPIIKKAPKPITDSLQALHMACRRGVPIDQNGMPFLVENDMTNRDKYLAHIQQNYQNGAKTSNMMFNDKSTQSIRSISLHNVDSLPMRVMLGDQVAAADSTTKFTEVSEQSNSKNHSTVVKSGSLTIGNAMHKQTRFQSTSPSKRSLQKLDGNQAIAKNQRLIKKVDHLITKFDESFRQNAIQQKAIRDAQHELQAAKDSILERINQEEEENADDNLEQGQQGVAALPQNLGAAKAQNENYESDGSYKHDSCMEPSDDEELNHAQSEAVGNAGIERAEKQEKTEKQTTLRTEEEEEGVGQDSEQQMNRTFQTNKEREEYYKFMNTLQEKYSNLKDQATQARTKQWDTRQELRKVSQPKMSRVASLAASKKSFKRNRNHDNLILNERSGELMSNVSSKMISPQEIFKLFENQNIQKNAQKVRLPPSYRSTAEKQLAKQLNKTSGSNIRLSLLQLTQSKAKILSATASKGNISNKQSQNQSPNSPSSKTNNIENLKSAKAQYKPVPIQTVPKRASPVKEQQLLSTERTNFRFDINEAANREAQKALMNRSIMDHLSMQEVATTPKSRLPRKLQERERKQDSNNRDIETFISSPQKKSLVKANTLQATSNQRGEVRRDEAYQTMIAFKKSPEPLIANDKLPNVSGRKEPDSEKKTMHMTMTEIAKPFTPKDAASHSPYRKRDSGLSGTITTTNVGQGQNPMQTTMFGSEDFNLREKANQSGAAFECKSQNNMQIVDEADEMETINRPSFFDALQMKITPVPSKQRQLANKNGGGRGPSPTPGKNDNMMNLTTPVLKTGVQSGDNNNNTAMTPTKLNVKGMKKKLKDQVKLSPKRPIASSLNNKNQTQNISGFNTTRGGQSKLVDLKPINHTEHKKFVPHPNCFKKFRTSLPPARKQPVARTDPVSPYQMMLDEMKNNERPTIQNMDDSLVFHGGEMTIDANTHQETGENNNKLRATYMAFEDRLEKMMQQTTTVYADQKALMGRSLVSEFDPAAITNKFAKGEQTLESSRHQRPYFKNEQPLNANNITSILERRFQETDQNFQKDAQRLLEDVRKIETIQGQMGRTRQVGKHNNSMMSATSAQTSTLFADTNAFKTRHGSLQAPVNQKQPNIKEKLQALKLSEANSIKGSRRSQQAGDLSETALLREQRRRKSAFVTATDEEHRQSQLGSDANRRQNESRGLRSPFEQNAAGASSNNSQTTTPVSRGFMGQSAGRISCTMYGGDLLTSVNNNGRPAAFDQVTDRSQVSLTFKQFQQNSQKDHTRDILPNVTPAIKR